MSGESIQRLLAKLVLEAVDNASSVVNSSAKSWKNYQTLTERVGLGLGKLDAVFAKDVEKLKLSEKQIDQVARSWDRLVASLRAGGQPRFGTWLQAQDQWKTKTLADLQQVSAAYERHAKQRHSLGLGPLVGGYVGYKIAEGIGRGAEKVAEDSRERAAEYFGGLSPEMTRRAADRAREVHGKFPSVGTVETMGNISRLYSRFGDFDEALNAAEPYARAQVVLQTVTGGKESNEELGKVVLGLEGLGLGKDPRKFNQYLDAYVRAKSVNRDFSGEEYLTALQTAKVSKYGLSDDFIQNVLPTMVTHVGGSRFGTQMSTAFNAIEGLHMTPGAADRMFDYDLVDKWHWDSKGKHKIIDQIKGERELADDPNKWAREILDPALKAKGVDVEKDRAGYIAAIEKLFSAPNAAGFFTNLLLNRSVVDKDRPLYGAAPGMAGAEEARLRDPFVAWEGLSKSFDSFLQTVGGPYGETAAKVMNAIADALNRISQGKGTVTDQAIVGGGEAVAAVGGGLLARKGWRWLLDRNRTPAATSAAEGGPSVLGTIASALPGTALFGGLAALDAAKNDQDHSLRSQMRSLFGIEETEADRMAPAPWEKPQHYTVGDVRSRVGMPAVAEVKGNAELSVNVTVEPSESFLSRIESVVHNAINVFNGSTGTAGSTGLSMPQAVPRP
jgi:hypothetical protein